MPNLARGACRASPERVEGVRTQLPNLFKRIWKLWQVEATKEGEHRLHLTLTAILEVEGESMQRKIETFAHMITVEVTTGQRVSRFVANNWQWLWTAILIPIVGWLWRRQRSGKTE